ncbi:chemotaxis protein CheX [Caldicellulosiruptoraceae bacterium PP1]
MAEEIFNSFDKALKNILGQFNMLYVNINSSCDLQNIESKTPINIILGLLGDLRGSVIIGMDNKLGNKLVENISDGFMNDINSEMARSALSELGNMITAYASTNLFSYGYKTDITTPTLVVGEDLTAIVCRTQSKMMTYVTEHGNVQMVIGLWQ